MGEKPRGWELLRAGSAGSGSSPDPLVQPWGTPQDRGRAGPASVPAFSSLLASSPQKGPPRFGNGQTMPHREVTFPPRSCGWEVSEVGAGRPLGSWHRNQGPFPSRLTRYTLHQPGPAQLERLRDKDGLSPGLLKPLWLPGRAVMKLRGKDGATAAPPAPSRPARDKEVTAARPGRTFFSAITCTAQSSLRHAAIFSKGSLARTKAVPGRQEETGSGVGTQHRRAVGEPQKRSEAPRQGSPTAPRAGGVRGGLQGEGYDWELRLCGLNPTLGLNQAPKYLLRGGEREREA